MATTKRPPAATLQPRPIMIALELLGRRTVLRILWELRDKALNFRGLQEACGTNSRLLNMRLQELRQAGIVDHDETGYHLTRQGRRLRDVLLPLNDWSRQWAREISYPLQDE